MTLHWPPLGEMNRPTEKGMYFWRCAAHDRNDADVVCMLPNIKGTKLVVWRYVQQTLGLEELCKIYPDCQFAGPIEWPKEHGDA